MVGILVHGDNHFIVRGPMPSWETALDLTRHWSLIQIGASTPPALDSWQIVTREFRENLEWAVVMPGDGDVSSAVMQCWTGFQHEASRSTAMLSARLERVNPGVKRQYRKRF
jgi:hypothetical protein